MQAAESVEWIVASGEVDALMLEYNLIQRHRPRFNIRYRDDKSYPYLALTVGEEWPRAQVLRGAKRKKVRYFGPYGHAWAIRDTLDALTRVFPVRTCSNAFFDQRARAKRPCLYFDIGRCSGPCVPEVSGVTHESYRADVDALADFLSRQHQAGDAASRPRDARGGRAPGVRAGGEAPRPARGREARARGAGDGARSARRHRRDRHGRRRPRGGVPGLHGAGRTGARPQGMGRRPGRGALPTPSWWPRSSASSTWSARRCRRGCSCRPSPPTARCSRHGWASVAAPRSASACPSGARSAGCTRSSRSNAEEAFHRHKLRRASDFGARSRALTELADRLGLDQAPLRIECYDISNLGPTDTVGSMVVFEDGLPKRSDYRRFRIKGVAGQDDFASMEEMLRRRFSRLIEERCRVARPPAAASPTRRRSSWSTVAGGSSAWPRRCWASSGCSIPHIGLAKRLEEVYFPDHPEPLMIPRGSEALFVLQHLRDEAHRFAITYHRQKRESRALASPLDEIPGVGRGAEEGPAEAVRLARPAPPRRTGADRRDAGHRARARRRVFERLHAAETPRGPAPSPGPVADGRVSA